MLKEIKIPHDIDCRGCEDAEGIDYPKVLSDGVPAPSVSVTASVENNPCPAIAEEHFNDTDSTNPSNLNIVTNVDKPDIITSGLEVCPPVQRRQIAKLAIDCQIGNPNSSDLEPRKLRDATPDGSSSINTPILRESARIKNTVMNSSQTDNSSQIESDNKLINFLKKTSLKCKEQLILFCMK